MSNLPQTLREIVSAGGREFANRTALTMVGGSGVTYAQLSSRSHQISEFLLERGITRGDRIALLGENMPNWGIAFFAVTSMGAVAVPILPDFHATDIARIIQHSASRVIFVSKRFFDKIQGSASQQAESIILLDDLTVVSPSVSEADLARESSHRTSIVTDEVIPATLPDGQMDVPTQDDLAAIIYTSGTTGHSKGVMLTHGNLVSDAIGAAELSRANVDDRFLSILPLAHTYEATLGLITPAIVGASVYYLEKPPTAPVLLPALSVVQPTIILSVPLIIEKIYKAKIYPELTRSALLRRLYGIPSIRKILNRVAGKKLLHFFGG